MIRACGGDVVKVNGLSWRTLTMLVLGGNLRSRYPIVGVLNGTVAVAFVPSPTTWQWQIFGKSKKGSLTQGILVCVFVSNVNSYLLS